MKIFNKDNHFITSLIITLLLFIIRQSFYLLQIDLINYRSISYEYLLLTLCLLLLIPIVIITLYYLPSIFVINVVCTINLGILIKPPSRILLKKKFNEKIIIQKNRYKLIQVFRC